MYKVGVVGYGTIGKRVADAVLKQKDMELIGVTGNSYNYKMEIANAKGIKIFTVGDNSKYLSNGITPAGTFDDLLKQVDIVVDCCPKVIGANNKQKYMEHGIKALFQGGEKADVAEVSFVAQCNYNDCIGKSYIRVVSCNTTGLSRTIHAINRRWPIHRARATLIRRAGDPADTKKGPINSIKPALELPSHHGPDVRTVLPTVEVFSTAVIVPTTLMHMHNLSIRLKDGIKVTTEEILEVLKHTTRVRIVRGAEKINSTAEIMEYAKDLGHERGDMMDVCIWEEGVGVHGDEIFFMQAIHQESDVVPENIDAIRAAMGYPNAEESIRMTNESLGLNGNGE